jgi:hypothetical protein
MTLPFQGGKSELNKRFEICGLLLIRDACDIVFV